MKAVIFDVDGVLVDSRASNINLFKKLLVKAGYPEPTDGEILKAFHMPLWQSIQKLTGSNDQKEIERIWKMGQDPQFRAGLDKSLFEFPDKLEDVLEELHQKYKLAVVTSRVRIGMDDFFSTRQIKHLFDIVITFEDSKNPKPHPEPLQVALKRLNIKPEEAVYIGDSDTDIEAARDAGMLSIHLSKQPHKDATSAVKEFNGLISAIEALA